MYKSPFDAVRKTLATDGIAGLYRGFLPPLATVAAFNAVLFSSRGAMEKLLKHEDGSPMTVADHFVAGMGAGVAVSFLATPTELLKCRLQFQSKAVSSLSDSIKDGATLKLGTRPYFRGPLDAAKHIYATEGGLLGFTRGINITLIREVPGNGFMFGAYEGCKMGFAQLGNKPVSELSKLELMFSGGVGGAMFWLVMFPSDLVKSKIQTDFVDKPEWGGIWSTTKKIYRQQGIRGFYAGFTPCMLRSFPANAVTFIAYEQALLAMQSLGIA